MTGDIFAEGHAALQPPSPAVYLPLHPSSCVSYFSAPGSLDASGDSSNSGVFTVTRYGLFVASEQLEKERLLRIQTMTDGCWEAVGVPIGWMTRDALGDDCFCLIYMHQNVLTL